MIILVTPSSVNKIVSMDEVYTMSKNIFAFAYNALVSYVSLS